MDNVLNRPLFRNREARDRLNDIAGVQRFQDGGPVQGFQPGGEVRPEGLNTNWRGALTMTGGVPSPVVEGLNFEPVVLNPGTTMAQQFLYDKKTGQVRNSDGSRLPSSAELVISEALRSQEEVFAGTGLASLQEEADRLFGDSLKMIRLGEGPSSVMLAERLGDVKSQIPGAEAAYESAASRTPLQGITTRDILAVEGPEALISQLPSTDQKKTLDIFNTLDRAAERAAPEGPSGMEQEARGRRPAALAPSAPGEEVIPTGPSGMEQEARGRGPMITNPAEVAAGLNAEDPAVRQKTVADFMQEYAAAAPEYKGVNKNLLLAQIGFAIAAGESPNAMQNIANGLLAGSDAMLKDKAAKDEFDRQVQLAAMQYGFGEVAQERALGRQFTDYVTSKEVTYRGKKYGPNESIPVLHSDIINGRMPDGVVSESINAAMLTTDATIRKALVEAEKEGRLAPEQYRQTIAELDKAASDFSKARNTIPLLEASIIRNANGQVTGLRANAMKAINQAASFAGIDLGKEYESPEAYQSAMQTVAARMVQNILGESGANISNVDRELVAAIVGVAAGGYGNMFKDPQVLNAKLQEILQQAEGQQQSALDTYNTLMEGFGGVYSPSGTPVRSLRADRVFAPEEPVRAFEYIVDESGRYVKRYLDGGN